MENTESSLCTFLSRKRKEHDTNLGNFETVSELVAKLDRNKESPETDLKGGIGLILSSPLAQASNSPPHLDLDVDTI